MVIERGYHSYHMVERSPWPVVGASGALGVALGVIVYMHYRVIIVLIIGVITVIGTMVGWWRDIIREATYKGEHTRRVRQGIVYGIILFIVSEVCLFVSLFWAYIHNGLSPAVEIGNVWPPIGIQAMLANGVPLVNTVVLLSSGATITIGHHGIISRRYKEAIIGISVTVLLGGLFSLLQYMEYKGASYTIADSVYGSAFYITTGAHGLHVLIGSIFIGVCLCRLIVGQYSSSHLVGFEGSVWYWHFVDIVWLCLYIIMYWWGA